MVNREVAIVGISEVGVYIFIVYIVSKILYSSGNLKAIVCNININLTRDFSGEASFITTDEQLRKKPEAAISPCKRSFLRAFPVLS